MMPDHPETASPARRSPGAGGRGWRGVAAASLGSLLLGAALVVVSCGSTDLSGGVGRQLGFGVSMAQRGLWSEALFRFERAHQLDPNSFRVLNNLAVAYEANGRFDEALATYRRALALDPDDRNLRRNYARFVEFYQSFRPEAAVEGDAGAPADPAAPPAAEPAAPPWMPPGAAAGEPDEGSDAGSDAPPDLGSGKEVDR
jgi:tetratricopeptide (TPR) repeat protein